MWMAILFSPFAGQIYAQDPHLLDDRQVLRELLKEMRLLRQTLERANINAYRAQITVERLRIQQGQVERLVRLLEEARSKRTELQFANAKRAEQAKEIESSIQQESDTNRRTQLEAEHSTLKAELGHQKSREQQLIDREAQLVRQLDLESAKLAVLESKLDNLEREIENALSEESNRDGVRESKKQL